MASPDYIRSLLNRAAFPLKSRVRKAFAQHHNVCVILIPEVAGEISNGRQWSIFSHEIAHCNGVFHDGTGQGWYLANGEQADWSEK